MVHRPHHSTPSTWLVEEKHYLCQSYLFHISLYNLPALLSEEYHYTYVPTSNNQGNHYNIPKNYNTFQCTDVSAPLSQCTVYTIDADSIHALQQSMRLAFILTLLYNTISMLMMMGRRRRKREDSNNNNNNNNSSSSNDDGNDVDDSNDTIDNKLAFILI